jgi:hypothetical protein
VRPWCDVIGIWNRCVAIIASSSGRDCFSLLLSTSPAITPTTVFPTPSTNSASSVAYAYPSSPTKSPISSVVTVPALLTLRRPPFLLQVSQSPPSNAIRGALGTIFRELGPLFSFVSSRDSVSNEPKYLIAASPNSRLADIGLQLVTLTTNTTRLLSLSSMLLSM